MGPPLSMRSVVPLESPRLGIPCCRGPRFCWREDKSTEKNSSSHIKFCFRNKSLFHFINYVTSCISSELSSKLLQQKPIFSIKEFKMEECHAEFSCTMVKTYTCQKISSWTVTTPTRGQCITSLIQATVPYDKQASWAKLNQNHYTSTLVHTKFQMY